MASAAEGAIQVHEVDPARAVACEPLGDGEGIVGVGGGLVCRTLAQTHHAPALDVDGGIELHDVVGS